MGPMFGLTSSGKPRGLPSDTWMTPKIPLARTVAGEEHFTPIRGPVKQEIIGRMLNERDFGTSLDWHGKDVAGRPTSLGSQVIRDEAPVRRKAHAIALIAPVQRLEHLRL